jgi:hypothetical protein
MYEIRAVLPEEDGRRRYRIKSLIEPHERVVPEDELSEDDYRVWRSPCWPRTYFVRSLGLPSDRGHDQQNRPQILLFGCRVGMRPATQYIQVLSTRSLARDERDYESERSSYFMAFDTLPNVALTCDPRPFTAAIITTAIPAAMRPNSMQHREAFGRT